MNNFIASYYQQVRGSVAKLTSLTDEQELDTLTRGILASLWERKEALEGEERKGVFIYKVVLAHVLAYLKEKGEQQKLDLLQKILLINPRNIETII